MVENNAATKEEIMQPALVLNNDIYDDERFKISDGASDIISENLGVFERWGLLICIIVLLLCFAASWFIEYPNIVKSRGVLWAENGPKEIIPRQNARLVKLLVVNNHKVEKNGTIAWLESTANHEEVIKLSVLLDSTERWVNEGAFSKLSWAFNTKFDRLGELQDRYRDFMVSYQKFCDYKVNGFYLTMLGLIEKDIGSLDELKHRIEYKESLVRESVKLAGESFVMNESLMKQKVLSLEQFRVQKREYVNQEAVIPDLQASLIQNDALQREKRKELIQINHDLSQQQIFFFQALHSFQSAVCDWSRKYIISSPVSGIISFVVPLQENQSVVSGDIIGYIIPEDTKYSVRTYLSQNNFGKVKVGQNVQLRFDAYPYNEVGIVEGTLGYISNIPTDSGFLATVYLDRGLFTNNHYYIPYKNGLKADALIITENMRLLKRLYFSMIKDVTVK
ncbi:HlyD family secretion protein [Chitinophaga eiseniae]|uniref:HlyD family efflux transporter periplasmic adaptor subunit n=1 Tax=Chitinophaga eiseniae TaxID=634771 RepID=A0A847SUQ4_9BACT|nr:HlyD family efflux transporter periplasmic adaptor subunit [Chitinophaga eiseniae]NLR81449.1 HlyD family efflux transporter periplasmic adaptor subunit [Chitinophaga eiseniae]